MTIVYGGHPQLIGGCTNGEGLALDEFNGAGRHDVWPDLCQSSESLRVMILTADDYLVFECSNLTFPFENRNVIVGEQNRTVVMAGRCAA